MAARDPAYRPGDTTSPFATLQRYRQSRAAPPPPTGGDLYSSCLELAWPGEAAGAPESAVTTRASCHSLPSNPVCERRVDGRPPPPAFTLTEPGGLRRLASCESGVLSSVGEVEWPRSPLLFSPAHQTTSAVSAVTRSPAEIARRAAPDFRRIVAYFQRSGAGGLTLRLCHGRRERSDRLSLERTRLRLQRAELALVPGRLVADYRQLFDRR